MSAASIDKFESFVMQLNVSRGERGEAPINNSGLAEFLSRLVEQPIRKVWVSSLLAGKSIDHTKTVAVFSAMNAALLHEKSPAISKEAICVDDATASPKNV